LLLIFEQLEKECPPLNTPRASTNSSASFRPSFRLLNVSSCSIDFHILMNHVHTWIRGEKWTLGNAEQAFQKVLYKANLIDYFYITYSTVTPAAL